jgi:hypothetical protein
MDDFDIDLSDIGGTNINNLNNSIQPSALDTIRSDRNKLISNRQPDMIDFKDNNNSNIYRPKKNINMNNLIKNVESDLKKYSSISDDILGNDNIPTAINEQPKKKVVIKSTKTQPIRSNNDMIEVLIYILIFMILNNKFIIDLIFNFVPYMNSFNNTYPNLLIRSVIFGLLVFIYKKYYSNN